MLFRSDWNNPSHRIKRLLAEFLGVAGLMVILSGVAGILARFAGANVPPYQLVAIAAITSGAYLVAAIYFLGDISAHFDPVVTLAFGIRRDMSWGMVVLYALAVPTSNAATSFWTCSHRPIQEPAALAPVDDGTSSAVHDALGCGLPR